MNASALLTAVVAALAIAAGSATFGYRYAQGRAAREELLIQKAGEASAERAAKAIAGITVVHKTIQSKLEKELVHVPDPDACRVGPDVLRLLNEALAGRSLPAPADSSLPGATASAD